MFSTVSKSSFMYCVPCWDVYVDAILLYQIYNIVTIRLDIDERLLPYSCRLVWSVIFFFGLGVRGQQLPFSSFTICVGQAPVGNTKVVKEEQISFLELERII